MEDLASSEFCFDMFQRLVSSARVTLGMWENHTEVRWKIDCDILLSMSIIPMEK